MSLHLSKLKPQNPVTESVKCTSAYGYRYSGITSTTTWKVKSSHLGMVSSGMKPTPSSSYLVGPINWWRRYVVCVCVRVYARAQKINFSKRPLCRGKYLLKHSVQSTWTVVTSRQYEKEFDLLSGQDPAF